MTKLEFENIYILYFSSVYRYLLKVTRDENIAEEITSETFFKALKSIDSFKVRCNIRTWLIAIAKNSYLTYLKKHSGTVGIDEVAELTDYKSDADYEFIMEDSLKGMKKIIDEIEDPYREVFYLRIHGELSFKEIGNLFSKSQNWACVTYHRARNKIRKGMEEEK